MIRLFFIRHGETVGAGPRQPFSGWRDTPLTGRGRAQIDAVAAALARIPFRAVYCSDLSRAAYGGRLLAGQAGLEPQMRPEWREIHFGQWEGRAYDDIHAAEPELAEEIFSPRGADTPFPGGESLNQFAARIKGALASLVAAHPEGGPVALSVHAGVCKTLWGLFLGLGPGAAFQAVQQDFAAINVADLYPGGFTAAMLVNGGAGADFFDRRYGEGAFPRAGKSA